MGGLGGWGYGGVERRALSRVVGRGVEAKSVGLKREDCAGFEPAKLPAGAPRSYM